MWRSLRVFPASINILGGPRSIKGFATLTNVVNLQFVAEVRAEVVRDQLELFSLSEEERDSIFGSPGVCGDSSFPR